MHFISRFRALFFSVTLLLLLTACMDENDDFVNEPVEVAYVSIYHAAPDAPELDIVVDGRVINRNPFDYTSYSGYLNFFTGSRQFRFNSVNADNALIDTTFNFEDGKAYSLFAINRVSDIEALLVVDSAASPTEGKAMVRFVNLAPDASEFDVAVAGSSTPLFEGQSFKAATQYQEITADSYSFEIRNSGGSDVVVSAEDVEILPGRYYTIITRGFVNPPQGNNNILSVEVLD
jgi:hypothetical protein